MREQNATAPKAREETFVHITNGDICFCPKNDSITYLTCSSKIIASLSIMSVIRLLSYNMKGGKEESSEETF